jgi:hypothetical protein
MERPNFFGDQFVEASNLNAIEASLLSQLQQRSKFPLGTSTDFVSSPYTVFQGGVFGNARDFAQDKDLKVSIVPTTSIQVAAGSALDAFGEFISVPSAFVIAQSSSSAFHSWASSADGTYYVKINYVEATGSVKHNAMGVTYPTRYDASYFVTVDNVTPLANEICLAEVVVSGGIVTGVTDRRSFVATIIPAQGAKLDPSLNRVPLVDTAYKHVTAVGRGTVTEKNPHGLSATDVGLVSPDELLFYGTPRTDAMFFNWVYCNTQPHPIFVEVNITMSQVDTTGQINTFSLYASPSGSLIGSGSVTGPLYELARVGSRIYPPDQADSFALSEPMRAMVPAGWYYYVSSTTGFSSYDGTIRYLTTEV